MFFLAPFSWLYASVMDIRNWMFNHGWLREKVFAIPTICIGNLAVGGTGKTPHAEWLVERLVEDGLRVATLSRGYGRRTKGFVEATSSTTAQEIGDEPLQMLLHFGDKVVVSVCENRCAGITELQERHPELDVIVLDDAYQHRYVNPSVRVLLTDYSRPYYDDHVLPWGRLRERPSGAARADIIIVTKCPSTLSDDERLNICKLIAPLPHQKVYFTSTRYAPLLVDTSDGYIAVVAGIANPGPLIDHLAAEGYTISDKLIFGDHHNFSDADLHRIEKAAESSSYVVTTAKDYARLRSLPLSPKAKSKLIVQDISVHVLNDEDNSLYEHIKHLYADHY